MGAVDSLLAPFNKQVTFTPNSALLPAITLDCSITENHSRESIPTEFELENAQTITDHMIVKPFALHIQALVTDAPFSALNEALTTVAAAVVPNPAVLGQAAGAIAAVPVIGAALGAAFGGPTRSVTTYDQMLALQFSRVPFSVLTSIKLYQNIWIKKIGVPRDAKTGGGLIFDLDLVQLLLVVSASVNLTQYSASDLAAAQQNKGATSANALNAYNAGQVDGQAAVQGVVGL